MAELRPLIIEPFDSRGGPSWRVKGGNGPLIIESFDSRDGPRWRIKGANGEILATSEAYSSAAARDESVRVLCAAIKKANFRVLTK